MNTSVLFALALTCLAATGCDDQQMPVAEKVEAESTTKSTETPTDDSDPTAARDDESPTDDSTGTSETPETPESASETTLTNSLPAEGVAQGAESGDSSDDGESEDQLQGEVNLNTASIDQLDMLPGVGPAIAGRIADYREKRRFKKPSHLERVKGIGDVTFAEMKPYVTIQGETTLSQE